MSKHKRFQDIQDPKEQQNYLSKLIKKHHDDELKQKWGSIVKSTNSQVRVEHKKYRYIKLVAAIGLLLLIALAVSEFIIHKQIEPSLYALKEINQPISHPGLTKGLITDNNNRSEAILNFNKRNFAKAIANFSNIENPTTEDSFYLAMSQLYSNKYDKAAQLLDPIAHSDSILNQEAKWYLTIAYVLNNSDENAVSVINQIKANDWNYSKAQELLKSLTN